MATNDIKIRNGGGTALTFKTDDRNTSLFGLTIKPGEPVVACGNYAARIQDNEPFYGSQDRLIGVCSKESTETATADGTVDVITVIAGQTVLEGKASTVANVDTAAELLTYLNFCILFDSSNNVYSTTATAITIDENATNDPNKNGLILIGGSADADGLCYVQVGINATLYGSWVGQTID